MPNTATRLLRAILGMAILNAASAVAEVADVHLTDGSVIRGELTSIAGGRYTVVSAALGSVVVDEQRVDRVVYARSGAAAPVASPADTAALPSVADLRGRMLADPQIMALLESLRSDPAFQAVANDPEIQRAVMSGDFTTLLANPRLLELLNNDTVRAVTRELQ